MTSYLLCGTPRTGSTLLCSALAATGVAGRPESYFREPDQGMWAARWGLTADAAGEVDPTDYVRAAIQAGSTPNGVLGARVMWGSLEVLLGMLPRASRADGDLVALTTSLGPLQLVHLTREDVVDQAVSWARAEQTSYWQQGDVVAAEPVYDEHQIARLEATIQQHNTAWQEWFARFDLIPLEVKYEDLEHDLGREVARVLERIGVELPPHHQVVAAHRRQADKINSTWAATYRAATRA